MARCGSEHRITNRKVGKHCDRTKIRVRVMAPGAGDREVKVRLVVEQRFLTGLVFSEGDGSSRLKVIFLRSLPCEGTLRRVDGEG
jgi:hypothetical protein